MASCEKILIAGFSGAGKSAFLKAISADTPFGWDKFNDLDDLIAKKSKSELSQLIALEGWEKFRTIERETLFEWLQGDDYGILALGGGTLTKEIYVSLNRMPKVRIIYLDVDFETCWRRMNDPIAPVRPLMQKGRLEMEKIYAERVMVYNLIPWKMKNQDGTSLNLLAREFWEGILRS
jgi:shikimate kinase